MTATSSEVRTPTPRARKSAITTAMQQSYRKTSRRLIGHPPYIESFAFPMPLTTEQADVLEGFRLAAEDDLYVVESRRDAEGRFFLRAWTPRLSAVWKAPFEEKQRAEMERFTAEVLARGYEVQRIETADRIDIRATRPTT